MPRKPAKRRRLPNGFGQISEIKGQNLRKPYRAMVTVGKNKEGRPIQRMLKPEAYFKTYNDAYMALLEYHKHPNLVDANITMDELYQRYIAETPEDARLHGMWKNCEAVYSMHPRDIRKRHIRECVEHHYPDIPPSCKPKTRLLLIRLLDYAMEYDLAEHNYAKDYSLAKEISEEIASNKRGHIAFTDDEMNKLWRSLYVEGVDLVLIQCYMGWRPSELLDLKISNIDLKEWFIKGGMKTAAGKNRLVPIHPRIRKLVEARYDDALKNGRHRLVTMDYQQYRDLYSKAIGRLGLDHRHRPHDPRVQFVTMAKASGMDEWALKRIVGHALNDITEEVYTKRDPSWLMEEMKKIR